MYYFLKKNVIYVVFGFIVMIIILRIDYSFWKKNVIVIGVIVVVLLLLVLIFLGIEVNGVKRWLGIGVLIF